MKRIIYYIIFFLYLIPLYSQEYSYKVFGEDGIYERNIKNDKYTDKLVLKYKEKKPPYLDTYFYNDKMIAFDQVTASLDNKAIFYELDKNTCEFKELYRVNIYSPEIKSIIFTGSEIYCIEYELNEDKYFLTKRYLSSSEVKEKTNLEISKQWAYSVTVTGYFFYHDYIVINFTDNKTNYFSIVSKKDGKELIYGKGKISFNDEKLPLFLIENKQKLYKISIVKNQIVKENIKISISDREEIEYIKNCGSFYILQLCKQKKSDLFTSFVFGVKTKSVYTSYICKLKGNEMFDKKELKRIKE